MANKKATAVKTTKKASKPAATSKTKTKVATVKAAPAVSRGDRLSQLKSIRTPLLSAFVAELIGTFILAAIVLIAGYDSIAVMFGLIGIGLLVAALSGAHVNPAITIGAWITRKIAGIRALAYVVAQALGAILAFVVVSMYVDAAPAVSEQAAMFGQQAAQIFSTAEIPADKTWYIVAAEVIGLTILGFAYASAYRSRRRVLSYSLTIGSGVFAALFIATGLASYVAGAAVINPAVAISVNALAWDLWPILTYVVAPIIGSVIGFGLHSILSLDNDKNSKDVVVNV